MFDNLLAPSHLLVFLFLLLPITVIGALPYWFIFKKADFSPGSRF